MKIERVPIAEIKEWADNPRLNASSVDPVARSIKRFGFNVPILCDRNHRVIAGHSRLAAARKLGMVEVPVIELQLSEEDGRAFAVADNKTAEIAKWDARKLRTIAKELEWDEDILGQMGFSRRDLRRMLGGSSPGENGMPKAKSVRPVPRGQRVALGKHVLMCGDSRAREAVELLTEGCQVDHVFAGPPYYNQRSYSRWQDYETYLADMRNVMRNCKAVLKKGGIMAWNIANGCSTRHAHVVHHATLLEDCGLQFLDMLVWVKTGANYSVRRNAHIRRNRLYYPAPQWEALLIYQKPGGQMARMTPSDAEYMWDHHTDVWRVPAVTNQMRLYGHPAVCPVEIPFRTVAAYTPANGTVFEPFGGSGTTLIAAHRLRRRCFVLEKRPSYCGIIRERFRAVENHT